MVLSEISCEFEKNKGFVFYVKLMRIPYSKFQYFENNTILLHKDKNLKVIITFRNAPFILITDKEKLEKKNKSYFKDGVLVRKHKMNYIDFIYEIPIRKKKQVEKNVMIFYQNEDIEIKAKLNLTYLDLMTIYREKKVQYDNKLNQITGKNLILVKKDETPDIFDTYKETDLVNKSIKTIRIEDEYKKMGIYLSSPTSFNRCEHCINYINHGCENFQSIDVSPNHACKRFRSRKTYFGGGFSPK